MQRDTELPLSVERPETANCPQVAVDPVELGLPPADVLPAPGEEPITLTHAQLADVIADAVAAAVDAQAAPKATTAKVRAAALDAITPQEDTA